MRRLIPLLFLGSFSLWIAIPAVQAYDGLDLYDCVISAKDRVNSGGNQLSTVREILAQDRANYHKFRNRDAKDAGDQYFTTPERRLRWQKVQLKIDPNLKRQIVSGGDVAITVLIWSKDVIEIQAGFIPPNAG